MAKSDVASGGSDGVAFVGAGGSGAQGGAMCRGAHHSVPVRRHDGTISSGCLGVLPVIRRESLERVAEEDDSDKPTEDQTIVPSTVAAVEAVAPTNSVGYRPISPVGSDRPPSYVSPQPVLHECLSTNPSAEGCCSAKPLDTDVAPAPTTPPPESPSSHLDSSSSSSSEWSAILERIKALDPVPAQRIPFPLEKVERMTSVGSCCCRICQSSNSPESLISPCRCKGSLAYVHLSCLERWLNQSGRTYCELCQFHFNAIQTPRYRLLQSMRLWYCHPRHRRQLLADAVIAVILTCVTLGLVSIILLGMRHFILEGAKLGISAHCTQFTITLILAVVTSGYIVTIYLLVKDQIMPWLQWWRTNVNVRILLDVDGQPRAAPARVIPPRSRLNTLSRVWGTQPK